MSTAPDLLTARWRASSYSNTDGGMCVEVADNFPGAIPIRDSKTPKGPALIFQPASWRPFIHTLKSGSL